jgi:hypothetical protein
VVVKEHIAEQINATCIMVKKFKQHAEASHLIKIWGQWLQNERDIKRQFSANHHMRDNRQWRLRTGGQAQLEKTLVYPSCERTKLKKAVHSTSASNQAAQRIDVNHLFFVCKLMMPSESLREF